MVCDAWAGAGDPPTFKQEVIWCAHAGERDTRVLVVGGDAEREMVVCNKKQKTTLTLKAVRQKGKKG